jgi:hypothetical protein
MAYDADTDEDSDIVSAVGRVSRTDIEALRRRGGPTKEDLEAMPATTEEDWKDAELISPIPPDILEMLLEREKAGKKAS